MKIILFLFLLLCSSYMVFGQDISNYLNYSIPKDALEKNVSNNNLDSAYQRQSNFWLNGRKVGERAWWPNGQLAYECPMLNGNTHGVTKYWHNNGVLMSEDAFENGVRNGFSIGYYSNGQKFKESQFVKGAKVGKDTRWYLDGTLVKDLPYKTILIISSLFGLLFGFWDPRRWFLYGIIFTLFCPLWSLLVMLRHSALSDLWPITIFFEMIRNTPSFLAAFVGFVISKIVGKRKENGEVTIKGT